MQILLQVIYSSLIFLVIEYAKKNCYTKQARRHLSYDYTFFDRFLYLLIYQLSTSILITSKSRNIDSCQRYTTNYYTQYLPSIEHTSTFLIVSHLNNIYLYLRTQNVSQIRKHDYFKLNFSRFPLLYHKKLFHTNI